MLGSVDFLGVWSNRFLRKWETCMVHWHTLNARFSMLLLGIKAGTACQFYGPPLFRRAAFSSIWIGERCNFRSAQRWTNQLGINRPCTIQTLRTDAQIIIGDCCGFSGTVVAAAECIELGEHVLCGANVTITDTDWHHVEPSRRSEPNAPSAPVKICNNVWLGMNVIVLKGVTIGENTVVGAGSIVVKDLPANVVAAGKPARVIH